MALPVLSATISAAATGQFPARASAGTASILMAYPVKMTIQYRPVLSARYPDTERRL
jgi:hypothetical protein